VNVGLLLLGAALLILVGEDLAYGVERYKRFHIKRNVIGPKLTRSQRLRRWVDRKIHAKYYRVDLPLIRDFIGNLQLAMSLEDTLSGAIIRTSEQFKDKGYFGARLMRHVRSRLSIAPDAVIAALARDFNSSELDDVVLRLELARDSGLTAVEALNVSLEEVEHKIQNSLERDIQRSPVVLTIPMVVGVFFATLMLAVFPLVQGLLRTMTFN
jgi:hypothetical protein